MHVSFSSTYDEPAGQFAEEIKTLHVREKADQTNKNSLLTKCFD